MMGYYSPGTKNTRTEITPERGAFLLANIVIGQYGTIPAYCRRAFDQANSSSASAWMVTKFEFDFSRFLTTFFSVTRYKTIQFWTFRAHIAV